jgi:hypothetical protein
MTTQTITLTDFLLARIEEDEAAVELAIEGEGAPTGWLQPLRESLTAQRRIVEEACSYSPELEHGDNGEWAFDAVLKIIATTHAHHPDFRSEWSS